MKFGPTFCGPKGLPAGEALRLGLLVSGDDYELLFGVPPDRVAELEAAAVASGTPVTRIGRIEPGEGVRVLGSAGVPLDLGPGGYRHF